MYIFLCPNCGRKEYSAWSVEQQRGIKCGYCKNIYTNPYYTGDAV